MGFLYIYILLQDGAEASYQFVYKPPTGAHPGRLEDSCRESVTSSRNCNDVTGSARMWLDFPKQMLPKNEDVGSIFWD
jgi:hypothetical protein